jgi:hypothetical protein
MANEEHLAILRQGVEAWNRWREENPKIRPDLQITGLAEADLRKVDFRNANLQRTELRGANLTGADLTGADLAEAGFITANLAGAVLDEANLKEAALIGASLIGTSLIGTSLTNVSVGYTVFANTDLSSVIDLETVQHQAPSTIGIDTLIRSGKLPEAFLRGCGVTDSFIEYLPSLLGAHEPIQYHSCFISYSTKDEAFARRLHERMRANHLRVWFTPEDIQGGKKIHEQLEGAIQLYDKLLLVLSDHSIESPWVETEIYNARQTELRQQRRKLFPIRLTDMDTLNAWRCFDADTGKDLAREVREYHIPDFSNWKDNDAFELAFARLLRDLRATEARPAPPVVPPMVVQPSTLVHRDSLIATKTRRLHLLEQQQARQGPNTPVDVLMELEDLSEELERLRAQQEGEG